MYKWNMNVQIDKLLAVAIYGQYLHIIDTFPTSWYYDKFLQDNQSRNIQPIIFTSK